MIESGHIACDIFAFNTNNLSSVNEQKILPILFKILHLSKKQVAMICNNTKEMYFQHVKYNFQKYSKVCKILD